MKKHLLVALPLVCPLLIGGRAMAQTATPMLPNSGNNTATASTVQQSTNAYNAGIKALAKNDLVDAASNFETAAQLSPGDANAELYLGYVRLKQNRWDDAVTALEKAKSDINALDDSLKPILWNNLGLSYAKTNRPTEALNAYSQALQLDKTYADARYNLAFAQLAQKDYKDALSNLLLLRSANPDDLTFQTTVYDGLAAAYEGVGDWGNALGVYRKVVQLNANNVDSRFNFALALKKAGRSQDAIDQLKTLLKMRSDYTPGLSLLGDLYLSQHQWKDAATVLEQYTQVAPNQFNAWFNLGVAYDHAADFDNALRAYTKAEQLNPKDPAVKNNIGRIYFKRKKYDSAALELNNALQQNFSFDDARLNLALVLMAQEKWTDAAAQWKIYLSSLRSQLSAANLSATDKSALSVRSDDAHSALALCYMHAALYADARDQYKQLLISQPKNVDAKVNLALCYYHTRNFVDSVKLNREIIADNPKNAIAYNNLGVALEGLNRPDEARENYRKALAIDPNYSDAKNNLARLTPKTAVG